MKNFMIKALKFIFNKFFLILFSNGDFPKTNTGSLSLIRNEINNSILGKHIKLFQPYSLHSVCLGDYSYIAKNGILKNVEIGKFCSIGPNFSCGFGLHPTNGISTAPMFYSNLKQNGMTLTSVNKVEESKKTFIGNDVFIGANVTLLDGIIIGDGAIIGAGAVVTKDIPPYAIVVGVPAKIIKYRFNERQIEELIKIKWWNFNEDELRDVEKNFFDIDFFIQNKKM